MRYKRLKTTRRKPTGFTAVEILLALVVVAVLFGLIFAFYRSAIERSKHVEAVATVDAISKAEEINQMNTGEYVAAANTQEVNERLGLNIEPKWYNYKVVGVTNDNFVVLAEKILDDINNGNLTSEPTVIARNNSGPISPDSVGPAGDENTHSGDGTPPGSNSPSGGPGNSGGPGGGGAPGGGGTPGSGTPGGGSPGTGNPGGGGRQWRYPHQSPLPASLLDLMKQAPLASSRYDLINDKHINMVYVDPKDYGLNPEEYIAWWVGISDSRTFDSSGRPVFVQGNTIYVNQDISSTYTQAALASIITHEATHADYSYNPQTWIDATKAAHPELTDNDIHITTAPGNSIDQEYQADRAMVQLWNVITDSANANLDEYARQFALGEDSFKAWLKTLSIYANLPNY